MNPYHILTQGTRVIPVYADGDEFYLGRSKTLTKNCLVPEICPVPTVKSSIVHESYRFSPFKTQIRYIDKRYVVGNHPDPQMFEHLCCGFLFRYEP